MFSCQCNLKEVTSASACTSCQHVVPVRDVNVFPSMCSSRQGCEWFSVNMYFPSNPMKIAPSQNSLNTFLYIFKVDLQGRPLQTPLRCAEQKGGVVAQPPSSLSQGGSMKGTVVLPQKGAHASTCTSRHASRSTQQKHHSPLPYRYCPKIMIFWQLSFDNCTV